jgi:hypothetical protein
MNLVDIAKEKGIGFKLPIINFQETRDCIVIVIDLDESMFHLAWDIGHGKILAFEYIAANYPAGSYCIYETKDEYRKAISEVPWIQRELLDNDEYKNPNFVDTDSDTYNPFAEAIVNAMTNNSDDESTDTESDTGSYDDYTDGPNDFSF